MTTGDIAAAQRLSRERKPTTHAHRHHPSRLRRHRRHPALGSVGYEREPDEKGERLICVGAAVLHQF
jgi:hypothetical protein